MILLKMSDCYLIIINREFIDTSGEVTLVWSWYRRTGIIRQDRLSSDIIVVKNN